MAQWFVALPPFKLVDCQVSDPVHLITPGAGNMAADVNIRQIP